MGGSAHRVVATALLLALLAVPAGAVADDEPDDDVEVEEVEEVDPREELREERRAQLVEAREELRAAERTLEAARAATRSARSRGAAADGGVRVAEEAIVPPLLARREAEEDLRRARRDVRALRRELAGSERELEEARERLVDRVVRAYKQGSVAADTALPLLAVREAATPGELARTLKDLEALALTGAGEVDDLIERITRLEAEQTAALARRQDATVAREEAAGAVESGEETAATRRRTAESAEDGLLTAIERELAAERARAAARERVEDARSRLAAIDDAAENSSAGDAGPRDDDTADEASATADRLQARLRAHRRQQSVPEQRRRTADDWVCPVEGGRFVNDWAFPRSQDRRHEGTDVFAPTGTPIRAVTDGEVARLNTVDRYDGRSGFGGLTVTYEQDDQRFYNAHLDAIHPDMAIGHQVQAGDVIGWVGRTGNARGTPPHLHIGWYVDDAAVNPYASLAVACHAHPRDAEDSEDLADSEEMEDLQL
jgi:peptidoglycan LD-endopeptidase LytH